MPRRRAVRTIGVALVGAWTGVSVRAPGARARGRQNICGGDGWQVCDQETEQCQASCCPPGSTCCPGPRDPSTGCFEAFTCCDPCGLEPVCSAGHCLPGPVAASCCEETCGPNQTCKVDGLRRARCVCKSGSKCGPACCKKGQTCCGGEVCCDKGAYCSWRVEKGPDGDELAAPGTCKRDCARRNRAGTNCCGTGYKPNKTKTRCVRRR
jgi:hypothetical protein